MAPPDKLTPRQELVKKYFVNRVALRTNKFALKKQRYLNSFYHFVKCFWKAAFGKAFVDGWHIKAICDHAQAVFEKKIKNLLTNIPPKHGKSMLLNVMFPAWVWAKDASKKFIFFSYSAKLTIRDSVFCRRLILSEKYQKYFGDRFRLMKDQNAKLRFDTDKGGSRIASSIGGVGTGEGADIIVIDDPHSVEEAESDITRESVIDWLDGTVSSRGDSWDDVSYLLTMQRLHVADASGKVIDFYSKFEDWVHLKLPIRFDPKASIKSTPLGFRDPRTKRGELLWPQRYSENAERIVRLKMGPYRAAGQLDQEPAPLEGGLLKRKRWKIYDEDPRELVKRCEKVWSSWDMPFKKTPTSAYLCCQIWGKLEHDDADRYLLHTLLVRASFTEAIIHFKLILKKWRQIQANVIENKAYASSVINTLEDKIQGLDEFNPVGDKTSRVIAIQPLQSAGNIWLPSERWWPCTDEDEDNITGLQNFIRRCADFPNTPFKDDIDTMTQANIWEMQQDASPVIDYLVGIPA